MKTAKQIYIDHYLTEEWYALVQEIRKIDPDIVPDKYRVNRNSDVECMEFLSQIGLTFDQFETASFKKEMINDRIHSAKSTLGYIKRQSMMTIGSSLDTYTSSLSNRIKLLTMKDVAHNDYDSILEIMREYNFI